jgi:alkanesulfonate monooxygenase
MASSGQIHSRGSNGTGPATIAVTYPSSIQAAQGTRLDKRLWTAVAEATGARGNSTALVGTPEQAADALPDYYDLGSTTFLIRGFDPLEDAIAYGKSLLPPTRAIVAERVRDSATAAE